MRNAHAGGHFQGPNNHVIITLELSEHFFCEDVITSSLLPDSSMRLTKKNYTHLHPQIVGNWNAYGLLRFLDLLSEVVLSIF